MILTTKARYAIMALIELSEISAKLGDKPASLSFLASNLDISLSYLEQLFFLLKKKKIVKSVKGPGGGYKLNFLPEQIYLLDIIIAVGEDIKVTRCNSNEDGCMNLKNKKCNTHFVWKKLEDKISDFFKSVSLKDICVNNRGEICL